MILSYNPQFSLVTAMGIGFVWLSRAAAYGSSTPPTGPTGYETGGIMSSKRMKRGLGF